MRVNDREGKVKKYLVKGEKVFVNGRLGLSFMGVGWGDGLEL